MAGERGHSHLLSRRSLRVPLGSSLEVELVPEFGERLRLGVCEAESWGDHRRLSSVCASPSEGEVRALQAS